MTAFFVAVPILAILGVIWWSIKSELYKGATNAA